MYRGIQLSRTEDGGGPVELLCQISMFDYIVAYFLLELLAVPESKSLSG
jgi:hypothetical protein